MSSEDVVFAFEPSAPLHFGQGLSNLCVPDFNSCSASAIRARPAALISRTPGTISPILRACFFTALCFRLRAAAQHISGATDSNEVPELIEIAGIPLSDNERDLSFPSVFSMGGRSLDKSQVGDDGFVGENERTLLAVTHLVCNMLADILKGMLGISELADAAR